MATMTYGSQTVQIIERPDWQPISKCPCRRINQLTPDKTWFDLKPELSEYETHVMQPSGVPVPPGLLAAQELINAGARHAYVVEAYYKHKAVMRADLHGASADEPIHELIKRFRAANEGRIGGFPDVAGFWDDGRVSLQELKLHRKDQLSAKQHAAADCLRSLLGDHLDLKVLEWGQDWD